MYPIKKRKKRNTAAAAAESLQSCPTPCNPVDGSPPGSLISGIEESLNKGLKECELQRKEEKCSSFHLSVSQIIYYTYRFIKFYPAVHLRVLQINICMSYLILRVQKIHMHTHIHTDTAHTHVHLSVSVWGSRIFTDERRISNFTMLLQRGCSIPRLCCCCC